MAFTNVNTKIQSASRAHLTLLDSFIRITEEKIAGEGDVFVRDSLMDLLASMRDEREGYLRLSEQHAVLETAA
ncbi:hypothetical protein [Azospirillum sp.]|uniref:hypothetical protein n=1 Tax=Azospirillum sp. TaxID=34012 RepID=UPI002D2A4AE4|nr:hypothetical protein [Azospirillum sp.]HYD71372.1 hypothetical protein [Azospirillum sp.]